MQRQILFGLMAWMAMLPGWSSSASAQDHHAYVYDNRYNHNHYYPPRGYAVHAVPHGALAVTYHGAPYYYGGGIWYHASGPRFVVVSPPFGAVVPVLPPFYTTVWWSGVPYYYSNDVYYRWNPADHGYVVADKPAGADASVAPPPGTPGKDETFVYPKNGQSVEQQSTDRYECHRWAADQSGFDPTQPAGGAAQAQVSDARAAYKRAEAACLEGRGYTVK